VCGAKKEREGFFVESEGCDQDFVQPCTIRSFVCFGAASPRTLSSGRKGTMLASRVGFMALWQERSRSFGYFWFQQGSWLICKEDAGEMVADGFVVCACMCGVEIATNNGR